MPNMSEYEIRLRKIKNSDETIIVPKARDAGIARSVMGITSPMAIELIEYRGYELLIDPEADALVMVLKASGAKFVRPMSPIPGRPGREQLIGGGEG